MATEMITQASGLEVTAVSRLKHTELWEAAKAFGSASAMAKHLGISPQSLGKWINLQFCPPEVASGKWTQDRLDSLEVDLLQITGKLLSELFPESLRRSGFLSHSKLAERRHVLNEDAMEQYAISTRDRFQRRVDTVEAAERTEKVNDVLKTLTTREREVISLRYGMDGGEPHNYTDTGRVLGLTKERIRQLESTALMKLQRKPRAKHLVGLLPDGCYEAAVDELDDRKQEREVDEKPCQSWQNS